MHQWPNTGANAMEQGAGGASADAQRERPAPLGEQTCQCETMPEGTTCPACIEQRLLALLRTPPNPSLSTTERTDLSEAINGWLDQFQTKPGADRTGGGVLWA
jgi:hypothetical protein